MIVALDKEAAMTITIHPSPASFPLCELLETGLWAGLSPAARAVLGVLWDYYRLYPDACHPSRRTLAEKAGVSPPTVTRTIKELESVGLVEVTPSSGPGVNTYRLNWSELEVPTKEAKEAKEPEPTSGFSFGTPDPDTYLDVDEDGNDRVVYRRKHHLHKLPDGCVVNSADEVRIHSYLIAWKIPHWCNVPYHSIGVRGLHPQSTVDFVVGPGLVIEHFGLPRTQSQATRYNAMRRKKEEAIRGAGLTLITLEKGEDLTSAHVDIIIDKWANSTFDDLKVLVEQLFEARKWKSTNWTGLIWDELVADAGKRKSGEIPPAEPRGLGEYSVGPDGREAYVETEPRLVLAAHLGRSLGPKEIEADNDCASSIDDLGYLLD